MPDDIKCGLSMWHAIERNRDGGAPGSAQGDAVRGCGVVGEIDLRRTDRLYFTLGPGVSVRVSV